MRMYANALSKVQVLYNHSPGYGEGANINKLFEYMHLAGVRR